MPGPIGVASEIVRALAATIAPPAALDAPPPWLFPSQCHAYARALAALRRHRGVLLAEPTGSGKTYIALAVAWRWQRAAAACIVPAALLPKWRDVAARLGVPAVVASHEQVSRGHLPVGTRGLVLVDESHHFRHPDILRYGHLADFLVGRPALLLTATPVVHRTEDLAHQLRLAVRDDALAAEGLASLAGGVASGPTALGSVVVTTHAGRDRLPLRTTTTLRPRLSRAGRRMLRDIDELRLSTDGGIARLIRGLFWRALASSPAALLGALRRYESLLAHAADARASGRALRRQRLRQWVGRIAEQLVLWELTPDDASDTDLILDDSVPLRSLIENARAAVRAADPKLAHLCTLLADGRTTLIFCSARDTVDYLRRRLGGATGWCTGEAAGIGSLRMDRNALFAALGTATGPCVLIASDVAAEGLDLQAAERVVHYDLPWTAARLEQREGRAARLGSRHAVVTVTRFEPPAALEERLRQCQIITRSARAPADVGVGPAIGAPDVWQWRDVLAIRLGDRPAQEGLGAVSSPHAGALAGIAFDDDGTGRPIAGALLWVGREGRVRRDPAWLVARAEEAASAPGRDWSGPHQENEVDVALAALAGPVAQLLRRVQQARWNCAPRSPGVTGVLRRLAQQSRQAARRRDVPALAALERALAIVSGGLTAGETRLVERLAASADAILATALARLPPREPQPGPVSVRLTGLILFDPR